MGARFIAETHGAQYQKHCSGVFDRHITELLIKILPSAFVSEKIKTRKLV